MCAKKTSGILACISNGVASRMREVIVLDTVLYTRRWCEAAPKVFWPVLGSYFKKDIEVLEQVQRRATKLVKGAECTSMRAQQIRVKLFAVLHNKKMVTNCNKGNFDLTVEKPFFTMKVVTGMLSKDDTESPSLKTTKTQLDKVLSTPM
ncbi:hypothetical protein DUI87_10183 [Hirundo rustica rustica]|uniref:Uncharacterized protein n=1 Tax=Hirundo rustica rustica TaxID=333673 RepID=A0A3M0KHE6_HIRRU|nr:hypothetical protein DUI87_10183 [Hirundo rustica rustica]